MNCNTTDKLVAYAYLSLGNWDEAAGRREIERAWKAALEHLGDADRQDDAFVSEAISTQDSATLARLFALSEDLLGQHLGSLVGTTQRVLIEGLDKERGELWSGRTDRH